MKTVVSTFLKITMAAALLLAVLDRPVFCEDSHTAEGPTVLYTEKVTLQESHDRYERLFRLGGISFGVEIFPGFDDEWQYPGDFIVSLTGPGGQDFMVLPAATTRVRNGEGPVRWMSFGGKSIRVAMEKVKFIHHAPSASRLYKKTVFSVSLMSHDPEDRVEISSASFQGADVRVIKTVRGRR